jgi:predicted porin
MNRSAKVFAPRHLTRTAFATVLAILACASNAQAEVQVRGKLYPEWAWIRLGNARPSTDAAGTLSRPGGDNAALSTSTLLSSNSNWSFAGRERLDATTEVFWQFERGIDLGTGADNARETYLGLRSKGHMLRVGYIDTVYKDLGDRLRFFRLASGNFVSSSTILSKPAIGDSSAASFHLRRANSIRVDTDESAPFSVHLQYSPDEARSSTRNADLLSAALAFRGGPWFVALAHERHQDFFGGSRSSPAAYRNDKDPAASSTDLGTRLTVVYKLTKAVRIEANHAWLQYRETSERAGRFESMRDNAWNLAVDYRDRNWRGQVSFVSGAVQSCSLQAGQPCDVTGQHGWMLNAGVGRSLSPRTMLFALVGYLKNGSGASYNSTESLDVLGGQSTTHMALGILHVF